MREALNKMQDPVQQSICWHDGRLFENKEDWIVDSCTKCTCQDGKVVCRQITCPPVSCANPSFIDGECCPVCLRECLSQFIYHIFLTYYNLKIYCLILCLCWDPATNIEDDWSPWSEWTQCTVTCGSGTQQRGRSCDDTSNTCPGPSIQTRRCSLGKCDRRGMENIFFVPVMILCGASGKSGENGKNWVPMCLVRQDGGWSLWSPWSSCSVTCGEGLITRIRHCNSPIPQRGGKDCRGEGRETQSCQAKPCPSEF